jgi:hypothetical protein
MSDMNVGHFLQIIDSRCFLRALAGQAARVYVPNLDLAIGNFIQVSVAPNFKVVFATFTFRIKQQNQILLGNVF